jgi:hypothetical protein
MATSDLAMHHGYYRVDWLQSRQGSVAIEGKTLTKE